MQGFTFQTDIAWVRGLGSALSLLGSRVWALGFRVAEAVSGLAAQVSHIKANTKIPVLGHADGICHIYVDAAADIKIACSVVLDSKVCQPPASRVSRGFMSGLPRLRLHPVAVEVTRFRALTLIDEG